jgi:MFS family permease
MMLIAAGLAVAAALGRATPPVLLALGLLNGVAMAFNTPAWQVLTPRLVPRDELHRAIALQGMQFNLARVVGPALAGLLLAQTSATVLFALNTVSFVAVLLAIAAPPPRPRPPAPGPPPAPRSPRPSLRVQAPRPARPVRHAPAAQRPRRAAAAHAPAVRRPTCSAPVRPATASCSGCSAPAPCSAGSPSGAGRPGTRATT